MGLVDYSDSESDAEPVQKKPVAPQPTATASGSNTKKPFQKLVDRSGSSKIVVNLPSASAGASADSSSRDGDEPPAKRTKTAAAGASRFSAFGSFLPPPKKATTATITTSPSSSSSSSSTTTTQAAEGVSPSTSETMSGSATRTGTAPARGVQLRTGAEPSFARARGGGDDEDDNSTNSNSGGGLGLNLPPPRKAPAGPSIPAGQRPESEVKLVGKPLMFKPLSVARKPGLNKMKKKPNMAPNGKITATAEQNVAAAAAAAPPPKKKVSLFSMGADTDASPAATTSTSTGAYEPLFNGAGPTTSYDDPATTATADDEYTGSYEHYEQPYQETPQQQPNHQQSLTSIADDLNLSKEARRELFGRGGVNNNTNNNSSFIPAGAKVISFNMEQEYAHNEALRQSGTEQVYNPVRSIVPGKHSLRQMVSMVQNNQAALEESFVAGKNTRKDAAGRYGWK